MKRWEYVLEAVPTDDLLNHLNHRGSEGWEYAQSELSSRSTMRVLFKREKQSTPDLDLDVSGAPRK